MTTDRAAIARHAAAVLRQQADALAATPVLIGFDGFVDSIIDVVDQRHTTTEYDAMPTIERFAEKIAAAAGRSANFELVTTLQKLGGNGPIMANAMQQAGLPITYVGALGDAEIHPVFQDFASRVECVSISDPGYTDALEFTDGKLMLGKHDTIKNINVATLDQSPGRDRLTEMIGRSKLTAVVNWTMLTGMTEIWQMLADDLLPSFPERRLMFFDLCDPAKRTTEDLLAALKLLTAMQGHADVILGLNLNEAVLIAEALGLDASNPDDRLIELSTIIRQAMNIHGVVVHPRRGAAAAIDRDGSLDTGYFAGPFTQHPKLSTGAGDNFNAGFCLGLLAGMDTMHALATGTATSGFYVRNARSVTLPELADFLDDLPQPE